MSTSTPHTRRRGGLRAALVAASAGALLVPVATLPATAAEEAEVDCSTVPWMDTSLSAEARAAALLDASSQEQIYRWLVEQPANSPQQTTFGGVTYPEQVPCTPTVVYTDGPDGIRFQHGVTAFPATLALAASFDLDLAELKGAAQADEAFDKGKNVILGPGIASGRTPLSGRTPEYLGEDAVLSGLMAAAGVIGIEEGNDPDKAVLADLKHYVANEQETDRSRSSSNLDERTLREIYSLPFEIAIDRSDPSSVMCSYNQINGVYACENPVLQDVLKDDVGFDGYVVSDFGAVHSTAASLNAGMDQELNRPRYFTPALLDAALDAGEITQERVEEAAMRVVVAYIDGGLFDHPLAEEPVADASTPEHKAIALEMAQSGSVLLTNDGTLPLAADTTVALIGPTAALDPDADVDAGTVCALPWRFSGGTTLTCEDMVAPLDAFTDRGVDVVFDDGSDLAAAAETAAAADVAIVFGYKTNGEFSDPADLALMGDGDALIEAVAAANDETVVVLTTGTAVEMPWVDDVSAILEMWYPGEVFGSALASLVYGDVSPSGRLPMTFPASIEDGPLLTEEQYPGITDEDGIRQVDYSEGLEVGYRWWEANDVEPLFEFGHGLTYSEFDYSKLQVTPTEHKGSNDLRVRFRLTNTGDATATEVAQVYLELPATADEPSKRLAGWARVTLDPGEHQNVQVTFTAEDLEDLHLLEYYDTDAGGWVTPTGTFTVHVGGSVDTVLTDTFTEK
ncbi:beta-glucosidase [Demequina rhizosphaerae]|uniref:beta-glucosidase n=1 Tax=Demequina rhizosphaerae TaxID=1638985 RepID=UPI000783BCB7|nr:glycoside hydrolase family 3 C-terminal domain-containing protein [Demequina rhizosphaerae]